METEEKKEIDIKMISLSYLSQKTGVNVQKIHNNMKGKYNSLDLNEKTTLANTLYVKIRPIFNFLGFDLVLKRL